MAQSAMFAGLVFDEAGRPVGVLTRSDLLEFLAHNRG